MNSKSPSVLKNISKFLIEAFARQFYFGIKIIISLLTISCFLCGELFMYVSVNTVVCYYLLCILELPLRKYVSCNLARGSTTYATHI